MSNENYVTIGYVAKEVGRSVTTIKNWYEWAEKNDRLEELPEMRTDLDEKGTRYFKENDIDKFKTFRDSIKYGMMSDVSREKWGKRGERAKNE